MQAVILCGGRGMRMQEETEYRPKPLVPIGGRPILWHIMKIYSYYGVNEFILCLGYKGYMIKEYFMNFEWKSNDFTLSFNDKKEKVISFEHQLENWKVVFADTGEDSLTGLRLLKIKKYITEENFLLTYGDGLADVDIKKLIAFHEDKGKIVTITGVHPMSPFGVIEVEDGVAKSFKEKPQLDGFVNGGFMAMKREILDHLKTYGNCMLEEEPLKEICRKKQLAVYEHNGFWKAMDTYKDVQEINKLWEEGRKPWKIW